MMLLLLFALSISQQLQAEPLLHLDTAAAGNVALCSSGEPSPQSFWWNILWNAPESANFSAVPGISTQTGTTAYPGSKPSWPTAAFGDWPSCTGSSKSPNVYAGGVPQSGNLQAHLANLTFSLDLEYPDKDFSGVIGIDWEGWSPVYDGFLFGGYRTVSINKVKKEHPSWTNKTQIEAQAAKEFNAGAKNWILSTINHIKQQRPKARVGFYDTPPRLWHSYNSKEYGPGQRAHNDKIQWMWDAVDVLMPTLYIHEDTVTPENHAYYIRGLFNEAMRLANNTGHSEKVGFVPFTWMRYSRDSKKFLSSGDLTAEFKVPFEYPNTEANLVWGDPAVGGVSISAIEHYFDTTMAPFVKNLVDKQCDCAKSKCSGHGRCFANNTACYCNEGYSGSDCSHKRMGKPTIPIEIPDGSVVCPGGVSHCPSGTTCGQLSTGRWYCCPSADATICGNFFNCCPGGYKCNMTGWHEGSCLKK